MRILVLGGHGQLGRGLKRRGLEHGLEVIAFGRDVVDVTRPIQIRAALSVLSPHAVIDAAAYTDVDRAETDRVRAHEVNAIGATNVAQACAERRTPLVYVSTDYVFDGAARRPYREDDLVAPLNVYGETKAAGERAVLVLGGSVVRTSWLFGEGGPSFVHAIARRAVDQEVLRVVSDQHGCPTWVDHLADALLQFVRRQAPAEIIHVCGDEPATRHAFAQLIVDEARAYGPLACQRVDAVATADVPAAARRPANSVLDTSRARAFGLTIGSWRDGLRTLLAAERGARR